MTLPPLMVKVPAMVGTLESVTEPVVILRLLKVTADEPFKVPAPAKVTFPVPGVNVPLLVRVPAAAMVNVPAAVHASVPPFVTVVAVMAPEALVKVRLEPPLMVMPAGALGTEALMPTALLMVVVAPAGGTLPPSHVVEVFQSVAAVVI